MHQFVFQQMMQGIGHGHASFTLQAHHPGILAQIVDDSEQVVRATIVLDQFQVLHFHQIGLPDMIKGGADHGLAMGKAFILRAVQGEGRFVVQIVLSTPSDWVAPNSSSTLPLKM